MGVLVAVVAVVVVVATYLTMTAGRLDRLHARVDASAAALDACLVRRAAAASAVAASGRLGEAAGPLADAAQSARLVDGLGHDREAVENALTRALSAAEAAEPGRFAAPDPLVADLRAAATKAAFARRFHNDAVRDTLAVRRRWVPRLARLSGSAPLPAYFEIDDTALVGNHVAVPPVG